MNTAIISYRGFGAIETNMHWFPELQKCAKDLEHEIAGKDINLTPLFKYIEELERSATKINNQIKVDANSDLFFFSNCCSFPKLYSTCTDSLTTLKRP